MAVAADLHRISLSPDVYSFVSIQCEKSSEIYIKKRGNTKVVEIGAMISIAMR